MGLWAKKDKGNSIFWCSTPSQPHPSLLLLFINTFLRKEATGSFTPSYKSILIGATTINQKYRVENREFQANLLNGEGQETGLSFLVTPTITPLSTSWILVAVNYAAHWFSNTNIKMGCIIDIHTFRWKPQRWQKGHITDLTNFRESVAVYIHHQPWMFILLIETESQDT